MTDEEKLKSRTALLVSLKKDAEKILHSEDGESQIVDFMLNLVDKISALGLQE